MEANEREQPPRTRRVILDTDMGPDCDDAGALAILHALVDRGEAELLAVTHCTSNPWGAGCIDAINVYYGRPNIPIGTLKVENFLNDENCQTYNRYIAEHYPNRFMDRSSAPNAVDVLRNTLAQQEDHSVTFIAIGPMINLMHLLESGPDSNSPQSGVELVRRKVNELICMAGLFPSGIEWNVQMHAHSAQIVVQKWQTPIMFAGFEIGSPILTGARLFTDTPETNPVRKAYSLYLGSEGSRSSWDLTAVLYAVRGESSYWKSQGGGNVIITDTAESLWKEAPEKGHFYLQFNTDPTVILETLEELLIQPPKS